MARFVRDHDQRRRFYELLLAYGPTGVDEQTCEVHGIPVIMPAGATISTVEAHALSLHAEGVGVFRTARSRHQGGRVRSCWVLNPDEDAWHGKYAAGEGEGVGDAAETLWS